MKKGFSFMAAFAAALCTIACNKDNAEVDRLQNVPEANDSERTELTVGLSNYATKSTSITTDDEATVNTLQVLVFRGDALDAYGTINEASQVTVSCTKGSRTVYALVNAPNLSGVNTKTKLLAEVSELGNNNGTSFEMIGSTTVTLPQASAINIDVNRIASKVVVKKITKALTAPALAALDFKIEEIYLTNVAGNINYGMTANPTLWYNKMKYNKEMPELTYDAPAKLVATGSSYDTPHSFYCYPNAADDSASAEWGPRRTRLVVKVSIGTDTYYYPITLPVLENNKCYEISELKITRPGSDNQDTPVSFQDCTFKINVIPWTVVAVNEGIII